MMDNQDNSAFVIAYVSRVIAADNCFSGLSVEFHC